MSAISHIENPKPFTAKAGVRMLLGGLLGALVGYSAMRLAFKLHVQVKSLTWSDFLAIWLGISFVGIAIITAALAANRKRLAQALEPGEASLPATNQEVRTFRLQAAILGLAGILLLTPIFALGPMRDHPNAAPGVFLGIVVLFALQTAANVIVWKTSDEFIRDNMMKVASITFAIGQGALFLWAAAEHLHLVPAVTAWEIVTLLMTLYLASGVMLSLQQRHRG
jgi:hypothetical protein